MPVVIQGLKMTAIHLGLIEIGRLEMFLSLGGITFLTPGRQRVKISRGGLKKYEI